LIKPKDPLSRFFRSQSRWELLLLIASNGKFTEVGMWNYIDMVATRTESPMTIYNFIRDRIEDKSLVLLPGSKKSRKVLALSPQLESALNDFLIHRYMVGLVNEVDYEDPQSQQEQFGNVQVKNVRNSENGSQPLPGVAVPLVF
jgi:hypothetical protein